VNEPAPFTELGDADSCLSNGACDIEKGASMTALTTCAGCGNPITDTTNSDGPKEFPCPLCGSTSRNVTLKVETIQVRISPLGFQWYAKDFYEAYRKLKGGERFSPARLTLLAQAVELAAKSLHVHQGTRDSDLRKLAHSLIRACDPAILSKYAVTLTPQEETELKKMSELNEAKAFEYFWYRWPGYTPELAGIMHSLTGRPGLPDESVVEGLLVRLLAPSLE
jgi:predicted RNA-binding Zn-ribbon protein involved in translation (DUF1610 family)